MSMPPAAEAIKTWPAGGAVEHDAEIKFFIDRQAFFDQQHAHFAALGAGLMRDQFHAEHLLRDLACFVGDLGKLDAAAFAAAARVNLRFDDDDIRAEFLCCCLRFFGRARHNAARNRHAIFLEKCFALIFVNFHTV